MTTPDPVEISAGGVALRGEFTPAGGDTWVVCVHEVGGDIDEWRPLVVGLQSEQWNFLCVDLPGHGGSDGEWDPGAGPGAVQAALEYARAGGASHVAVAASGQSAMFALEATARALDDPAAALGDSLVLFSPGPVGDADPERIRGDGLATIILSGVAAPGFEDTVTLLRRSIGWTVAVRFPTDAVGGELLEGPHAVNVLDKIGSFVREQAVQGGGPGQRRARAAA